MSELKHQEFFIKLIAEFPEMPRMAIWLAKYGDNALASWGGITQYDRLWGMTAAGQGLGERFTSELGLGEFLYSLTYASGGVFLVVTISQTVAGFVFDKVESVDELFVILKDNVTEMNRKLIES